MLRLLRWPSSFSMDFLAVYPAPKRLVVRQAVSQVLNDPAIFVRHIEIRDLPGIDEFGATTFALQLRASSWLVRRRVTRDLRANLTKLGCHLPDWDS